MLDELPHEGEDLRVVSRRRQDDPAVAEELSSWGVDYITTNILEDDEE